MKKLVIGMVIASSLFFLSGCGENPAGVATDNMGEKQRTAATTQYEAENATLSGGAKKNTNHLNYSGTGFVDGFYNSTTALVTFTVNVATAGSYTLTTRYCAGNGTSSNTSLAVNGTVLKNITCNKTTNWDTWANEVETITLRAGNNTIVYKAASSSGACINIDYITVSGGSGTVYTITASASANGTITPSGSVSVNSNANQTFTIRANSGYVIYRVLVDGVTQGSAISTYTFSNVTANHTISATFIAASAYTINASAGANGTISPNGSVSVSSGANQSFAITAYGGYQVGMVTVDGTNLGAITSYTFNNVTANHTISATFVPYKRPGIYEAEDAILTGGAKKNNDHINYSGTGFVDGFYNSTTAQVTFNVNVATAGSYTLSMQFSAGNGTSYHTTSRSINGGAAQNLIFTGTGVWDSWVSSDESITLNAGNNTITYKAISPSSACINIDYIRIESSAIVYTITASTDVNGTISPNGSVSVSSGANQSFAITAYVGYQVGMVTVDGANLGAITSYTFNTVTANHTISATFVPYKRPGIYEAEDAILTGGAKKNNDHINYSGTGFVDGFYNSTTAQVTFTVNVATAGSYTLSMHFSAGNGTSYHTTSRTINGGAAQNLMFSGTGVWDSWVFSDETITLNAGNNTITYKAISASSACINIDYIWVGGN